MPLLKAEFLLEDGQPSFFDFQGRRHYRIRLSLEDPPPGIMTITYQLHDSYKNPIRVVPVGVPSFQEFTSSYGDYEIRVLGRVKSDPNAVHLLTSAKLSDALRNSYKPSPSPDIINALRDISDN